LLGLVEMEEGECRVKQDVEGMGEKTGSGFEEKLGLGC